jgi:hypothetical protein
MADERQSSCWGMPFQGLPKIRLPFICRQSLTLPPQASTLESEVEDETKKPVKLRRGRATVIDGSVVESQSFLRSQFVLDLGRSIPGGFIMAQSAVGSINQPVSIPVIPFRELLPWAIFGGLLMLLAIYFVGAEQGATSLIHGRAVHEFLHDGRHLLGFPCH